MKVNVYTLNSFAKAANGGNPAGVVIDDEYLTEQAMRKIAAKVGFSETAFIQKSNKADFKVRFFTPNEEVDLCGHATIALFYLLSNKGLIELGVYTQETKAGILKVENKQDGTILMNQSIPQFFETIGKKEIADSLNISEDKMMSRLPVQIVSTGIRDIFVPIDGIQNLHSIKPDFEKVKEVSKKYGVTGYHIFTLETLCNSTAHCRNLAPLYDIPEEAATGTSNGALSCYLYKHKIVSEDSAKKLVFEQGYSMNKPSEIFTSLLVEDGRITEVKVGGSASDIKEIEIEV